MTDHTIGIDISKDRLDAHRATEGAEAFFGNDARGLRQLLRWIGAAPARVIFEATGRYHLALERALDTAGHGVVKVNPRQAKRFCEALGVRAKTDRADAAMLARTGVALALEPAPVRPEHLCALNELVVARRALIKDRTAARNRAQGLSLPLLRRQNTARLRRIEAELAVIDREIAARIDACPVPDARRAILVSIPGVSEITAAALLAMAAELGALDTRQAGSLRASPRSPGNREHGADRRSTGKRSPGSFSCPSHSAAGAPNCATRSTCPPSSPCATTPRWPGSPTGCATGENRPRS